MAAVTNARYAVSIADSTSRQRLSALCSSSSTRTVDTTVDGPSKWWPRIVRHPETGAYFDESSAWLFVKAAIDSGAAVGAMGLERSPVRMGYVMNLPGYAGKRIDVKLEIGKSKVFGKSFHICENGRTFN